MAKAPKRTNPIILTLLWQFSFGGLGDDPTTMRTSRWGRPREEVENGLPDGGMSHSLLCQGWDYG
jgi:hypothetical protein